MALPTGSAIFVFLLVKVSCFVDLEVAFVVLVVVVVHVLHQQPSLGTEVLLIKDGRPVALGL